MLAEITPDIVTAIREMLKDPKTRTKGAELWLKVKDKLYKHEADAARLTGVSQDRMLTHVERQAGTDPQQGEDPAVTRAMREGS